MNAGHTILARAQLMLKMAASIVSLRIPAQVPGGESMREMAVAEASFMHCLEKLIEANPPGVRWLVCLTHATVAKGREQDVDFDAIIGEIADATQQAVAARLKFEARQDVQHTIDAAKTKPH